MPFAFGDLNVSRLGSHKEKLFPQHNSHAPQAPCPPQAIGDSMFIDESASPSSVFKSGGSADFKPNLTYTVALEIVFKAKLYSQHKNNKHEVTEGCAKTIERKGGNASDYSGKKSSENILCRNSFC